MSNDFSNNKFDNSGNNAKPEQDTHKLKEDLIQTKEFELRKQNLELLRLNKALQDQHQNIEELHNRILENEIRLKLAFNAVNDGIWDWNLTNNEIFFSDRFFTMLGFDAYQFPHSFESWEELIYSEDKDLFKTTIEKITSGEISTFSLEYRMDSAKNETIWILSRGSVVELESIGKPTRILGTHVDISSRKLFELKLTEDEQNLSQQNEKYVSINEQLNNSNQKINQINRQLQEQQDHLNSIFKSVPACIGLIAERKVIMANDYTSFMTGYELNEIIGRDTSYLYTSKEDYQQVYNALYKDSQPGETRSATTLWKMKNDTLIDVYITTTQINTDSNNPTYSFSALDITAQRIYEEELVKARDEAEKAGKLKTVFLSNMSHELRTPMNGIVGFAEMLQGQVTQAKKDQYLKVIVNSSKQLLKIISDIVDISKIETNEVETFMSSITLNNLIVELHGTFELHLANRNKQHIELNYTCFLPEGRDQIITDENKLRQIFSSLLHNAAKFTENGKISFGYTIKDEMLEFYVSDSGIGIADSEKEIIFEGFRQVESPTRKKYGGTGLGLAIAKGFTDKMGGKIWVESKKDEGSTFYFSLPYVSDKINEEIMEQPTNTGKWSPFHILVVEDDLTCMSLIYEFLEETGIRLTHAATGLEAVKFCRKDLSINLVLMDMRLPEMDGYEATKRVKEFRPQLPIIAQTAHAFTEDKNKCLSAGCDNYITKPLEREQLFELISLHLK